MDDIDIPIHTFRGQKVIFDTDLAKLYGVLTKVFNQAVKRNQERFPKDFRFQLSQQEYSDFLRSQNVTSNQTRGGRRYMPHVFTEHGALQAANVLRSTEAAKMSIYVVRAFVKMRNELMLQKDLLRKIAEHDKKLLEHDNVIEDLVHNLVALLDTPKAEEKPPIGFQNR